MKNPCCHVENRTRPIFQLNTGQPVDTSCSTFEAGDRPDDDSHKVPDRYANHHHFRGIFPGLGGFRLEYFP